MRKSSKGVLPAFAAVAVAGVIVAGVAITRRLRAHAAEPELDVFDPEQDAQELEQNDPHQPQEQQPRRDEV